MCDDCWDKEEWAVRFAKTNDIPDLLRRYAYQTGVTKKKIEVEKEKQVQLEKLRKMEARWQAVLAGKVLLQIPYDAMIVPAETAMFVSIYLGDSGVEFVKEGEKDLYLKVFVPTSTKRGDTIRLKRPSKSGRSYIAVIVEYAKEKNDEL